MNPNSEKCINKKFAEWIIKNDVSLAETKFGQWLLKRLDVYVVDKINTNIETMLTSRTRPHYIKAPMYKSENKFGELTARALARTPKYAVGAFGSIAAIHAAYEIQEGEDVKKEICKTALEFTTTLAGIAYLGALGYKHFATCGSLVGMGLGATLGSLSSKIISSLNQDAF